MKQPGCFELELIDRSCSSSWELPMKCVRFT